MKLKMAKNSLFAILLRSPWWISFLIAAVLSLIAAALLPDAYKIVGGISAALPFMVVGIIAANRQRGLPSAEEQQRTRERLSAMPWPEFSALLEQTFARDGYQLTRSSNTAYDFELERNGARMLVCARRWKSARIGLEALRALQAVREAKDVSAAVYICLGELTENARPYAEQHVISIWQAAEMAQVLRGKGPAKLR
ncbi:restriction endonuclease [Piscinibacter sakaiensis]|uniref:restriction endonuclease n=1 Tax=Piscinibacter sakaiensis TaxID=1547922 RepID=UPI003AAE52BC